MQPIHPFPARMAPEVVVEALRGLPGRAKVLDPMCGSGTVVRLGVERGHVSVGYDIDPLSVLMAAVWTDRGAVTELEAIATRVVREARKIADHEVAMPWTDRETGDFASYWFARRQRLDLAKIVHVLGSLNDPIGDSLRVCLSRVIITKDRGASLARDVSHSRPHRVRTENDYDVFSGFIKAARLVSARLAPYLIVGSASIGQRDARDITDQNVYDLVITSPPYLNAIDYLRGHRLALIWFGYELTYLRAIRSTMIGSERKLQRQMDVERFIQASPDSTIGEVGTRMGRALCSGYEKGDAQLSYCRQGWR